jgi:hypothetical protein
MPNAAHNRSERVCGGSGRSENSRVECLSFSALIRGIPPSLRGGGSAIGLSFCVAAKAGTAASAALARIPLFAWRRVTIVHPAANILRALGLCNRTADRNSPSPDCSVATGLLRRRSTASARCSTGNHLNKHKARCPLRAITTSVQCDLGQRRLLAPSGHAGVAASRQLLTQVGRRILGARSPAAILENIPSDPHQCEEGGKLVGGARFPSRALTIYAFSKRECCWQS